MNKTQAQTSNQAQGSNTSNTNNISQTTDYREIATIASRLFLISSLIINSTKSDSLLITASKLSLLANYLLVRAAELEAREQQIAPGTTTFANNLKLIATKGNLLFALVLFSALVIEVSIRQQPSVAGQPVGAGTAGALFL